MPTQTQARDLLHRAADQLEVGPPPLDALLDSRPSPRRRRFEVIAGALAAAGVVAAAIVVMDPGSDDSRTPIVSPASPTAPSPPTGGAPSSNGAEIISASGTCGATDGLALDVLVKSDRKLSMYVLMLDGKRILGKQPAILRPGSPTHIIVNMVRTTDAETVTLQLVPTWTGNSIAQLRDVPLKLAPGVGPCG